MWILPFMDTTISLTGRIMILHTSILKVVIGMGKVLKRINNVRLITVTDEYFDYVESTKWGDRHGFAQIDPKDFPDREDKWNYSDIIEQLQEALLMGSLASIVVEGRDVLPKEGKGKPQRMDYLIQLSFM